MRHVYRDVVAPSAAPTSTGHHWIDTVAGRAWISVGTASVADWLEVVPSTPVIAYTIVLGTAASFTPVDSTTYYCGGDLNSINITTYSHAQVEIPRAGTITRLFLKVRCGAGTGETVAHSIRLNDTTDVATINTAYDAVVKNVSNTSVSQAVIAGDVIALKIVCPAWVTNPTSVRWYAIVHIE